MLEGWASVSWHFVGVGPVVTDVVVDESHAAAHNATTATIGTNAGEDLNRINVWAQIVRVVRLCAYAAPAIGRGAIHVYYRAHSRLLREAAGTFFKYVVVRSELVAA